MLSISYIHLGKAGAKNGDTWEDSTVLRVTCCSSILADQLTRK